MTVGAMHNQMTEMRALAMGQYGHNNQPVCSVVFACLRTRTKGPKFRMSLTATRTAQVHHVLWLFALVGDRDSTYDWVRKTLDHAYGADFYAGDEDNGEQGAWFATSALALYAVAPGATEDYVLGSPIFRHVVVRPRGAQGEASGESPPLHLVAPTTSEEAVRVREVWWSDDKGGKPLRIDGPTIRYSALRRGGTLRFVMQGEPTPSDPPALPVIAAAPFVPPPVTAPAAPAALPPVDPGSAAASLPVSTTNLPPLSQPVAERQPAWTTAPAPPAAADALWNAEAALEQRIPPGPHGDHNQNEGDVIVISQQWLNDMLMVIGVTAGVCCVACLVRSKGRPRQKANARGKPISHIV